MTKQSIPQIIQGGMGVGVSNWRLAKAVAMCGQMGVVSGTFMDNLIARRLQDGDTDGGIRRALQFFPQKDIADAVLKTYFIEGGKAADEPYKPVAMHGLKSSQALIDLTVVANFVEIFLAREGHDGIVGVNYLTKIDLPTLPSLFGAMLAGVDYVLMGAGIPKAIPGILDSLAEYKPVRLKLDVDGASSEDVFELQFDPTRYVDSGQPRLKRPKFLAIVSSHTLANNLLKKASGTVDGFVVEHHTAGGHNAPPRGGVVTDDNGEPIYGAKDEPDFEGLRKLSAPFWLAGSYGTCDKLAEALQLGAAGIQVGTAFAFCEESGISDEIKREVIESARKGDVKVFTDPRASSSGYPFKVVDVEGTLSDAAVYQQRQRVCDLGYLRTAYKLPNGSVGFRCPGEPVEDYLKKGGSIEDTQGRKCLCNGLLSTVGFAQVRDEGYLEPALVTAGNTLPDIIRFLPDGANSYSAGQVIECLLQPTPIKG